MNPRYQPSLFKFILKLFDSGVYDQDAPDKILINDPRLYRQGRLGLVYKARSFWITMADALYQSLVIFFIALAAYDDTDIGMWNFGTTVATSCMFVMGLHASIENHCWVSTSLMPSIRLENEEVSTYAFPFRL